MQSLTYKSVDQGKKGTIPMSASWLIGEKLNAVLTRSTVHHETTSKSNGYTGFCND